MAKLSTLLTSLVIIICVSSAVSNCFRLDVSAQASLSGVYVSGNILRNSAGPLFLVGTNDDGAAYNPLTDGKFDDWWTWRVLDAQNIKSYGFNVIRLIVYWEELETSSSPSQFTYNASYVQKIAQTVQAYNAEGIYVYIDLHRDASVAAAMLGKFMPMAGGGDAFAGSWFTNTNSTSGREHLKRVWLMLSNVFKNQPGVIGYGICNEPHLGDTTITLQQAANDWFNIADYVIAALRSNGDRHVIFVNFAPWAQSAAFMTRKLVDPDVVYEPHFYEGIDQSTFTVTNNNLTWLTGEFDVGDQIAEKMAAFNVPFIVGEFGFSDELINPGDSRDIWMHNSLTVFDESPQLRGFLYFTYIAYDGVISGGGWQQALISAVPGTTGSSTTSVSSSSSTTRSSIVTTATTSVTTSTTSTVAPATTMSLSSTTQTSPTSTSSTSAPATTVTVSSTPTTITSTTSTSPITTSTSTIPASTSPITSTASSSTQNTIPVTTVITSSSTTTPPPTTSTTNSTSTTPATTVTSTTVPSGSATTISTSTQTSSSTTQTTSTPIYTSTTTSDHSTTSSITTPSNSTSGQELLIATAGSVSSYWFPILLFYLGSFLLKPILPTIRHKLRMISQPF